MTGLIIGLCAVPLFILGLFIKRGHGLMFLAGYNMMSSSERAQIDKAMLSKVAGNLVVRVAIEMALMGVAIYFNLTWAALVFAGISVVDTMIVTVRLSVAGISRKRTANKGAVIATVAITAVSLVAVIVIVAYAAREPAVNIADGQIEITGMYGLKIDFADVNSIELIEKSMSAIDPHAHKDSGYGGVKTWKGHFGSQEMGSYMLFVRADSSPTIKIERDGSKDIYISFKDSAKTETLYRELTAAVPSN